MLPHVIRFNAPVAAPLYAQLVSGPTARAADALADRVVQLLSAAGLPKSLKECGVSETILPLLAEEAAEQWTARFNPRPVTEPDILSLYQAAW
jgi:alcohol dehydrogenase